MDFLNQHITQTITQHNQNHYTTAFPLCLHAKCAQKKSGAATLDIKLRSYHRTTGTTIVSFPQRILSSAWTLHGGIGCAAWLSLKKALLNLLYVGFFCLQMKLLDFWWFDSASGDTKAYNQWKGLVAQLKTSSTCCKLKENQVMTLAAFPQCLCHFSDKLQTLQVYSKSHGT